MRTVNNEAFFNFTFGTCKDENLIVNLTEFVDSKVYAGGDADNGGDSDDRDGNLDAQPEPEPELSAQPDSETPAQVPAI